MKKCTVIFGESGKVFHYHYSTIGYTTKHMLEFFDENDKLVFMIPRHGNYVIEFSK